MTDNTVIPDALKKSRGRPRKYATDEERREAHKRSNKNYKGNKVEKDAHRAAQKKFEADIAACKSLNDFWAVNRAKDVDVVAALQTQIEAAADQRYWMESGWRFANDPDYVDLREGTADLDRFIREQGGLIKECKFTDEDRGAHCPQYTIWCDFWKDASLYEALLKENEPTRLFATYGIVISIFEYAHLVWSQNIRRHRETRLGPNTFSSGWKGHVEYEGDRCWLCQYAKFHGVEYEVSSVETAR